MKIIKYAYVLLFVNDYAFACQKYFQDILPKYLNNYNTLLEKI